jgi:Na+-translocating ferredoxin:NAD+ oxidoreductase RnfC subunit
VEPWVIVEGGPMMGRVVGPEAPVTKKTSGAIVLSANHPVVLGIQRSMDREVKLARAVCCQCRMCTDLCPRFNLGHEIRPHLAMRSLVVEGLSEPRANHITAAYLCCLCGVCEVFACPLGLSPRKVFDHIRQSLSATGQPNPHKRADCEADEFGKRRRIPLPRLIARLGLSEYLDAPDLVDLSRVDVPSVRIPLSQHLGAPALPSVEPGQTVREGDVIGEIPEGKLGARVHASQGGVVRGVTAQEIVIERS